MSAVDLSRVGACVLKHAVTGEVRPARRRAENVSQRPPGCPANSHGLEWRFRGVPWVRMLGVGIAAVGTVGLRIMEQHAAGRVGL